MKRVGDLLDSSGLPNGPADRPAGSGGGRLDEPCPICKGKGFVVYDVPLGHPDFGKAVPCRCTQARVADQRARALRTLSNLGALSRMTFDSFMPDVGEHPQVRFALHQAYDLSLAFAREPKGWLVLMGGYGCGKTHLAASIANYRIALGHSVLFVVVPDLLDRLRATYAPTSDVAFDERLDAIRETPLLILDDLGAHNSTAWAQEKLFQILNHRHNMRLPTVITTNQSLDELDPRITSRLGELEFVQSYGIIAPDYRQMGAGRSAERSGSDLSSLGLHRDKTFETFSPRASDLPPDERENLRRAIAAARAFAETPSGWLVFSGTFGCGKTHLAAAIANYQLAHSREEPMLVVVPDLLDHLRATFSPNSQITLDKVFEQVKSVKLLILDDLGTESATPWAREKLFQLLNHRYAAKMATVITTSESIEKVEPRLRSRMLDNSRCTIFPVTASSYRGGQAQVAAKRAVRKPRP